MKSFFFLTMFFYLSLLFSQEEKVVMDTLQNSKVDTLQLSERDLFIGDYSNRLNIKFEVSNEVKDYLFPINDNTAFLAPNIGIRYALVFSYRFLSVRIGIRSNPSKENQESKGETDLFQFKIKLLFDYWSHRFEYSRTEGYYVDNSDDIFDPIADGDNYIQFPDLTTKVFSGVTAYKFNPNYSIKATENQTEIQLKSAGSFIPSVDYWIYKFDGADNFLDGEGNLQTRDLYRDFLGFNVVLNAGYYYNFVLKKWYANIFAAPGAGIDIYKETINTPSGSNDENRTDFVFSIQSGVGIGYNSDKYFFGANYLNRYTDEKNQDAGLQIQTIKNSFFVFFGYRFRAPKAISKPVKYIERKVPVLDHDK